MAATKSPRSLRELIEARGAEGQVAYQCKSELSALRDMCFLDNEYGKGRESDISRIATKVCQKINKRFRGSVKEVRVLDISPWRERHHHVSITYAAVASLDQPITFLANLYERSRRPEDEDEERVGPRRGGEGEDDEPVPEPE